MSIKLPTWQLDMFLQDKINELISLAGLKKGASVTPMEREECRQLINELTQRVCRYGCCIAVRGDSWTFDLALELTEQGQIEFNEWRRKKAH